MGRMRYFLCTHLNLYCHKTYVRIIPDPIDAGTEKFAVATSNGMNRKDQRVAIGIG